MTEAALDLSSFVARSDDGSRRADFAVEGVTCAACISDIEGAVADIPGVERVRLNYTTHRLAVEWQDGELDPAEIIHTLAARGYRVYPFDARRKETEEDRHARWLLRCLAVAGFASMNIMLLAVSVWSGNVTDITPETRDFFHWISALIALPAVAYAGQPFFRSALGALRKRRMNMDVPISLGVLLILCMSVAETWHSAEHAYFDSAVMLLFFLLCGRYFEHAMRRRTRSVAINLAAMKADIAHRLSEIGEQVLVPASVLAPGDVVLVLPGERVPADGIVLEGASDVDEAIITGETMPRAIAPGAEVYSGTINRSAVLRVKVSAPGSSSLIDEIEKLLEAAAGTKSAYMRLADRAARLYSPVVHTAALLTLVGWLIAGASVHDALIIAIAVLIITCPCALALAIPTVQAVASGALFREGIFLNSGDAIERMAAIDTIVFDKTGTLTLPDMRVANAGEADPDLLDIAARLALSSNHPVAAAVAAEVRQRQPFADVEEVPGRGVRTLVDGVETRLGSAAFCGVSAESGGSTSIVAFRHGVRSAIYHVRQALRPDAVAVVAALQARGLQLHILSGDRAESVAPIATALGIATAHASVNPAEKIRYLEDLKAQGRNVLMVGDGINDAPALAAADVSISPISAADIAQAHADAVFLGERLRPVLRSVEISSRARALMKGNLWLAAVYNMFAVPLAIAGFVTPLVAAAAMSGSSILVTLNALRAGRASSREEVAPPVHSASAPLAAARTGVPS